MPFSERQRRARALREAVEHEDVREWFQDQLADIGALIESRVTT
jgi:trehalose-6-phosphate synthase